MGGNGAKGKKGGGGGGGSSSSMTQSEFYSRMTTSDRSEKTFENLMKSAPEGATVSVDNRAIGGFRGSTSGSAYEFRKTGDGSWKEIFGDHSNVSSTKLANMLYNSAKERRKRR